jgi:glycosyltransferase involved in cell wall biosynthesis
VRLRIAGAVANARETEYWERCKALIAQAGDCIRVDERFISDDELPALIADCHAMLLPYTGGNSESGVAALALANERAIIARNVGGLGTLLSAADLGIPIECATPQAVEQAIEVALALDLEGLRQKGANGAKLMNATRSWAEIGRKTVNLYARVNSAVI